MKTEIIYLRKEEIREVAVQMDQEGPAHPLQGEKAYVNGSHSGWIGFKILALFIYHPAMCCILKIAAMDVKSESSQVVSFFVMFNEVLAEIAGEPGYKTQRP